MKNNRKAGFTLVEAVVYMLICSIVLVMVAQLMGTMSGTFVNTRTRSEAKQLGDTVYTYLSEEMRYATYLGIHDSDVGDPEGDTKLHMVDGKLLRNGSDYYGEDFYLGKQVEMQIESIDAWTIKLTVRVLDNEGTELYKTGSTVECINIKITGLGLMYMATDSVNPTISYTRGTKA